MIRRLQSAKKREQSAPRSTSSQGVEVDAVAVRSLSRGATREQVTVAQPVVDEGLGGSGRAAGIAAVVVGEAVAAPRVIEATTVVQATTVAPSAPPAESPSSSARSSSAPSPPYTMPPSTSSQTGLWTVPGCGASEYGEDMLSGEASLRGGSSGIGTTSSTVTGTWSVPGTGTVSFGDGVKPRGGDASAERKARRAYEGMIAMGDDEPVGDADPVVVACGQGKSMYDVKGSLSSYVLLGRGREGKAGGEAAAGKGTDKAEFSGFASGPETWALRSEDVGAGEGGVTCSSAIFGLGSGGAGPSSRALLTGGKDSMLREWRVERGRPRLLAEIVGHSDWVSCCVLVPPSSPGAPPAAAVSGSRDGSVRIWSRSMYPVAPPEEADAVGKGGRKWGGWGSHVSPAYSAARDSDAGAVGNGGWSCASVLSEAHGTSEFITCAGSSGATAFSSGSWVATGGTDWTIRLWDVVKARQLGRLSFRGHNHPVRALAVSSDAKMLVSGGEDEKVIVWSPQSQRVVASLKGHVSTVLGVAVDPGSQDGQSPLWVASSCGGGSLLVWDPRKWNAPVATLRGVIVENKAVMSASRLAPGRSTVARPKSGIGSWEGETAGASMLNSINCLCPGGGGGWLFAAGETVVRAWRRSDGMWQGGTELAGESLGHIASLSPLD